MDMNNEKLQKFIDAVNSETERKVSEMMEEAENEKKNILSEAERESDEFAERYFSTGNKKNGNRYTRDISKAELDMKKEVLRRREELTDDIFNVVKDRLISFRNDSKYVDLLIKDLLLLRISNGAEVFLAPDDMKYADTLKKAIRSENVVFSPDENIKLGGVSVYNKDTETISDKTFDMAVDEQRSLFANSNAFAQ